MRYTVAAALRDEIAQGERCARSEMTRGIAFDICIFRLAILDELVKMGGELIFIVLLLAIGLGIGSFALTPKGNNQTYFISLFPRDCAAHRANRTASFARACSSSSRASSSCPSPSNRAIIDEFTQTRLFQVVHHLSRSATPPHQSVVLPVPLPTQETQYSLYSTQNRDDPTSARFTATRTASEAPRISPINSRPERSRIDRSDFRRWGRYCPLCNRVERRV